MKNPGHAARAQTGDMKRLRHRSSNPITQANNAPAQSARRDAPVICAACGRRVARKSRQQKFCSDRCRDFVRRETKARTAIKNLVEVPDTGQPTNPPKSSKETNKLQEEKSGSTLPLNVLGGYRWANSIAIKPELLRKIVMAEIGRNEPKQHTRNINNTRIERNSGYH
jgi:hypothetical protein